MNIELKTQNFPKFELLPNQDFILFLIKNELLGTKFMNQLNTVGIDTSFGGIELGEAILSLMGFHHKIDKLWEWYHTILKTYMARIKFGDNVVIRSVAFDFYVALRVRLHIEEEGKS